jgi:DinB family protein
VSGSFGINEDLRDYPMATMTTPNPYAADLGARDPLEALHETPQRIRAIVERWNDADFERSYAVGKWSIRKVLIHLAQTEIALPIRVRFALSQQGYSAHAFSQDDWLPIDDKADARMALDTYTTLRRFNVAMFRSLTPAQRERTFAHPEYGQLTVWWVVNQLAGHDLHHLKQLESIR